MTSRELPLDRAARWWRSFRERDPRPWRLLRRALVACAWVSLAALVVALIAVPGARGVVAQLALAQIALWQVFGLARSKSVSWSTLGRLFVVGAVVVAPLAGLSSQALHALVGGAPRDLWSLAGWASLSEEALKLAPALAIWWGMRRSASLGVADWGLIGAATGAGFGFAEGALRVLGGRELPLGGGVLFPGGLESGQAAGRMLASHAVLTALILLGVGFWLRGRAGGWLPGVLAVLVVVDHAVWNGRAELPGWVLTAHDVLGGGYLAVPALVALLVVATLTDSRDVNTVRADVLRLPGEDRLGPRGDLLAVLRAAPSGLAAVGGTLRLLRARRAAGYALTRSRADDAAAPEAIERTREATVAFGLAAAAAGLVALAVVPGTSAYVGGLLEPFGRAWDELGWWRQLLVLTGTAGLVGTAAGGWSRWLATEYAGDVTDHTPAEAAALAGGHLLDGLLRRVPPLPHAHDTTLEQWDAVLARDGDAPEVREAYAEDAYEAFRAADGEADVTAVARTSGLPPGEVRRLRERVFFEVHQREGRVGRLDADPDLADAWRRLRAGTGGESDAQVLTRRTYTLLVKEGESDGTVTYRVGPDAEHTGVLRFDPAARRFEVVEPIDDEDDRHARLKLLRLARHGEPWPERTTYEG